MAYQSEIEKLEQRFGEKPEQWFAALADAYRKAGELDMALDILNTWIEKRPNYTSGHIVRGRCLLDREQDEEAGTAFQGVLELDPENIIAIKALSDIATRAGDEGQARHWLQRLLEVDPMNEEAHAALEAFSKPAAVEPSELEALAAEPAAPAAAPTEPQATGADAGFDPLAIAHQVGDSQQVAEEETLQIESAPVVDGLTRGSVAPMAGESQSDVAEPAAPVEGLEPAGAGAAAEEGGVDASGLEISAFDEEMGWDAGERVSHAISEEDIEEALHAHENSLDAVAHALPGIEEEEVPDVGVEERESAAVEGLDVPPEAPEEEPEPVAGFEPTVEEAGAAPPAEPAEPAPTPEPAPEPQPAPEAVAPARPAPEPPAAPQPPAAPERAEPAAPVEARAEEEPLPLILPDEVAAGEAAPEPEPVLTETMAEVYVGQGHLDEALAIYRKLMAQQPGNAALAAKVAEIESRATAAPPRGPAAAPVAPFAAAASGSSSVSVVLAEILGVQPRPAAAPPPRPEGAPPLAPPVASQPTPAPPVGAPPTASAPQSAEPDDFSFDQFFGGGEPEAGGSAPTTRRAASDEEGSDNDFRNWLKSLKS